MALVFVGLLGSSASAEPTKPDASPPRTGPGANFFSGDYKEGLKQAPALLAAANIKCDLREALDVGEATLFDAGGRKSGSGRLFEVSCRGGLGYLITRERSGSVSALDCVAASTTSRIACMLPSNRHPAAGLTSALDAAGVVCEPVRGRLAARDERQKIRRYEVACNDGGGFILDMPMPDGSGPPPRALDCLAVDGQCRFTTHIDSVALLAGRIGAYLSSRCDVSDARDIGWIGAAEAELYEVTCRKGQESQLLELTPAGELKMMQPCSKVKLVGAACGLKAPDEVNPLIALAQSESVAMAKPTLKISEPDWVARPSGAEVDNTYPQKALRAGVSGGATLICRVADTGKVKDCFVIDESPAEFGFGSAALKMSEVFRMRPLMIGGRAVDGAVVQIPINFLPAR